MPKLALLNQTGETVGEINLADCVFGVEPNQQVVYDVVKAQRAAMRQGTVQTKKQISSKRRRKKTLPSKGYRTRSSRYDSRSAICRRRQSIRPEPA